MSYFESQPIRDEIVTTSYGLRVPDWLLLMLIKTKTISKNAVAIRKMMFQAHIISVQFRLSEYFELSD